MTTTKQQSKTMPTSRAIKGRLVPPREHDGVFERIGGGCCCCCRGIVHVFNKFKAERPAPRGIALIIMVAAVRCHPVMSDV